MNAQAVGDLDLRLARKRALHGKPPHLFERLVGKRTGVAALRHGQHDTHYPASDPKLRTDQ